MLTKEAAARLGLKVNEPPADAPPPMPGRFKVGFTEKCTVVVGGKTSPEAVFGVVDIPSYVGADFDGVIGWGNVKNEVFELDLDRCEGKMLGALPADLSGWNKWNLKADADVLTFVCVKDAETATIVIDTGAQDGVELSSKRWKEWRTPRATHAVTLEANFSPGSGLVLSEFLRARTMTLGGISLPDVPVMGVDQRMQTAVNGCDAVLDFFALTRLQLIVDGKNGFLYTRPVVKPSAEYDYNRLGAVFVPNDPEKSDELVAHVCAASPASDAGIRDGDLLLKVGDVDVTKWRAELRFRPFQFWTRPAGTELRLTLLRGDKTYETNVVLADPVPCE